MAPHFGSQCLMFPFPRPIIAVLYMNSVCEIFCLKKTPETVEEYMNMLGKEKRQHNHARKSAPSKSPRLAFTHAFVPFLIVTFFSALIINRLFSRPLPFRHLTLKSLVPPTKRRKQL